MPLLQFVTTCSLSEATRESFIEFVTDRYTDTMETTAGHVAVSIDERPDTAMSIGRGVEGPLLFLDAEIRRGRPSASKRAFAVAVMEHAVATLGVPEPNAKVVFTEHDGENMMGLNRVGEPWRPDE